MIQAAEDILAETAGLDLPTFLADRRRQKIVIRDLEVLGEASRKIPAAVRGQFPKVAWRQIAAMRNKLIHEYFGVDGAIVHATATQDIEPLLVELRALRASLDAPDREEG